MARRGSLAGAGLRVCPSAVAASRHHRLNATPPQSIELADRVLFVSGDLTRLAEVGLGVPADRVLVKPVDLFQLEQRILELAGRGAQASG